MHKSAIEIINSKFGIYYAVLNSSLILTFIDSLNRPVKW